MSSLNQDNSCQSTRREFAKSIGLLAAAGWLVPESSAQAEDQKPTQPQPRALAAQAFTDAIRQRYPNYLTEDQLQEVEKSIEGNLGAADRLNQFQLKNGDEPAFVFSADVVG